MSIFIINWTAFCITFGLMLLFSFIMSILATHFFTKDPVEKKFSIMELEFPSTSRELRNLVKGMYKLLPRQKAIKTIGSLRWHLYIDFLFMPCAYGTIFLLCMLVSAKMQYAAGTIIFSILAWAQIIPWLCDIIENIYLLRKIKPFPVLSSLSIHKAYVHMEYVKWGIALGATICSVAAICYFWLAGNYEVHSLNYLAVIAGEIILFALLGKFFFKKKKEEVM